MKKILKFIIFLSFFGTFLTFNLKITQAVIKPTNTSIPQEIINKRCNLVISRINIIITRYENNKQRHIEKYQRIKKRMLGINKILKSRGCDTAQIEQDYQKLDMLIKEFVQEYNKFIDLLRNTQSYICGQSQEEYLKNLNQSRKQLMIVKQKSLEIRNFYQSTIRNDLLQLKEQCKNLTTPTNTQ